MGELKAVSHGHSQPTLPARLSREALTHPWHAGESCTERAKRMSGVGAFETSRIPVWPPSGFYNRKGRRDGLGQAGLTFLQAPT